MGALANAVAIATATEFKGRVVAATIFHARNLILTPAEDGLENALAAQAIFNPIPVADRLTNVIAADPQIAQTNTTSTTITDTVIINKVVEAWPYIAQLNPSTLPR